jgi:hypothetical protein
MSAPLIIESEKPRHVFTFMPQFVPLVEGGQKHQTVRGIRKRAPRPGHIASLREWTGRPYASPQRIIGERWIREVQLITFTTSKWIVIDGEPLDVGDEAGFADRDGFSDSKSMWDFFLKHRGLPFTGHLISWWPEGY